MSGAGFRLGLTSLVALSIIASAGPSLVEAQTSEAADHPASQPGPHTLRLEGAGALMVGAQADRFDFGGGFGASYEYRFIDYLGVEGRYSAFFFPEPGADPAGSHTGIYHGVGAALRLHPIPKVDVGDLWISAGPSAVFTGAVSRFGLEAGVGFEFAVAERARLGPFIRYAHVFQPSGNALGPDDGAFLQFGLSVAFVPTRREQEEEEEAPPVEPEPEAPPEAVACPEPEPPPPCDCEEGAAEPEPRMALQREGEIEPGGEVLPERVLFPHADVQPTGATRDELDEVAREINDHPEWTRIVIEGHSSDVGDRTYNMRLSEQRAQQVRRRLIQLGVPASRLEIEAYGHTRPEVRGHTAEAFARNRRVVFRAYTR
jgi:outer membrane protein OmpA-like peptidoglycan-associated protein